MRGENASTTKAISFSGGTSPRARGKHDFWVYRDYTLGNIPACAGKTMNLPTYGVAEKEHPRVRGENFYGEYENVHIGGTSPRARRKRDHARILGV